MLELFNLSPDGTIQHKLSQMRHSEDHQYDKFHLDVQNEIGFMKTFQLANIREKSVKPRSSSLDNNLRTVESEPNLHKSLEDLSLVSKEGIAEAKLTAEVDQMLANSLKVEKVESEDDLSDTDDNNIDKILSATSILEESASFIPDDFTSEKDEKKQEESGLTQFYSELTNHCIESLKCDKVKYKEKVSSYKVRLLSD